MKLYSVKTTGPNCTRRLPSYSPGDTTGAEILVYFNNKPYHTAPVALRYGLPDAVDSLAPTHPCYSIHTQALVTTSLIPSKLFKSYPGTCIPNALNVIQFIPRHWLASSLPCYSIHTQALASLIPFMLFNSYIGTDY